MMKKIKTVVPNRCEIFCSLPPSMQCVAQCYEPCPQPSAKTHAKRGPQCLQVPPAAMGFEWIPAPAGLCEAAMPMDTVHASDFGGSPEAQPAHLSRFYGTDLSPGGGAHAVGTFGDVQDEEPVSNGSPERLIETRLPTELEGGNACTPPPGESPNTSANASPVIEFFGGLSDMLAGWTERSLINFPFFLFTPSTSYPFPPVGSSPDSLSPGHPSHACSPARTSELSSGRRRVRNQRRIQVMLAHHKNPRVLICRPSIESSAN